MLRLKFASSTQISIFFKHILLGVTPDLPKPELPKREVARKWNFEPESGISEVTSMAEKKKFVCQVSFVYK